jgi:class 3 adenylate cyclase
VTGESPAVDPFIDAEPELSAQLLKPLLRFYEVRFGRPALIELAHGLGTTLEVLETGDRWFSVENFRAFCRQVVLETGDPDINYKAGLAFVEPGILGVERVFARALLKPRALYLRASSITKRYSRVTNWTIDEMSDTRATISFRPVSLDKDDILFCGNRQGVLEAAPNVFGLPRAEVHHPVCLHRGGDRCEYRVRWTNHGPLVRPALWATVVATAVAIGAWLTGSTQTPVAALLAAGIGVTALFLVIVNGRRVLAESHRFAESQAREMADSLDENERKVERLLLLQGLNDAAAMHLDEDALLDAFLDKLARGSAWDRVLLMLVDRGAGILGHTRTRGFAGGAERIERLQVKLEAPDGADQRFFAEIVARGETVLIEDLADYARTLTAANRSLIEEFGGGSMLVTPFEARGEVLGLLVVDRLAGERKLDNRDKEQLRAVGAALGTALSNARLYHEVRAELLKNRKYSQFLPSPVVKQIQDDPGAALRLGGDRRQVALMFCDIAGFTRLSANAAPEDVVRGLNAWFGIADPVIEACNGIIDKRIGDGILVVFLPEEVEGGGRHPVERAAAAAVGMHLALEGSREQLLAVAPLFAGITVRWAVHWGEVIAGNLGSQARVEYTVIGDAVNTCARLEEVTPAGHAWLTGDAVRAVPGGLLSGAVFEREERLRGLSGPTEIWSISLDADATETGTWQATGHGSSVSVELTSMDLGPVPGDDGDD